MKRAWTRNIFFYLALRDFFLLKQELIRDTDLSVIFRLAKLAFFSFDKNLHEYFDVLEQ